MIRTIPPARWWWPLCRQGHGTLRILTGFLLTAVALSILSGCSSIISPLGVRSPQGGSQQGMPSPNKKATQAIVEALDERRFRDAARQVNQLLAGDPANARLHLLNGLVYYRQFLDGDRGQGDQAETGFLLALQFDPTLYHANYLLGLLYLDLHRFDKARLQLLEGVTAFRHSPEFLLALAHAAYYSHDLPLAVWAVDKYLALLPGDKHVIEAAAIIYAAAGDDARSRESLTKLGQAGDAQKLPRLQHRVEEWLSLFGAVAPFESPEPGGTDSSQASSVSAGTLSDAATRTAAAYAKTSDGLTSSSVPQSTKVIARSWNDCVQSLQTQSGYGSASGGGGYNAASAGGDEMPVIAALPSPCEGLPLPRMVILDVVIIRAEEINGYNQGVNLLDGLSVVLGFNWIETITSGGDQPTTVRTLSRSVGLPSAGLAYSLNIFIAGGSRAEVLARPSLIALDRVGSTFFSGSSVTVALTGQYSGSLQDKNIGVGLSVTPTFIDDETMLLSIKATRSFVQPIQMTGFGQSMTTSKNTVTASTRVRFGETTILSGLRESEVYSTERGVPVLSRIPIIQYLFGNRGEDEYHKNVLVMITPRKPEKFEDLARQGDRRRDELKRIGERGELPTDVSKDLRQLTKRYESNLRAVMTQLGSQRYFKEFRTGDLDRYRIDPHRSFERILTDLRVMSYF